MLNPPTLFMDASTATTEMLLRQVWSWYFHGQEGRVAPYDVGSLFRDWLRRLRRGSDGDRHYVQTRGKVSAPWAPRASLTWHLGGFVTNRHERKGEVAPMSGESRLFITPGFQFKVVDALMTNFHLPKTTLPMLVSAFAGTEPIRRAYEEAVKERYRFYSYGDAMLIV